LVTKETTPQSSPAYQQNTSAAHAAQNTNIVCFNCGEPGHIAPRCPKGKTKGEQHSIKPSARGHSATGTTSNTDSSNEIVCIDRIIDYNNNPDLPRPQPRPIPVVKTDFTGDEIMNTTRYVTLTLPINRGEFNEFLEDHIRDGIVPTTYLGTCTPIDDNLWIMLHDWPLTEQDRIFAAITYPHSDFNVMMSEAVIPALAMRFGLEPNHLPLCFERWQNCVRAYAMRRFAHCPEVINSPITVTCRNISPCITFYPVNHDTPYLIQDGDSMYISSRAFLPENIVMDDDEEMTMEAANMAIPSVASAYAIRKKDPTLAEIGTPANLSNYIPDSGATQHMTPRRDDLFDEVEGQNLGIEVVDGHVIKCSVTGKIQLNMLDDHGKCLDAVLHDVMYVPGLSRRLFSITRFAKHGHFATIKKDSTTLYFGPKRAPVTLVTNDNIPMAANLKVTDTSQPTHLAPWSRDHDHSSNKKRTALELLHRRLGHRKCRALLAASEHEVWADTLVRMGPEQDCVSCNISTIRASARNKEPHTKGMYPGAYIFMDILHPVTKKGLTSDSTYAFYIILVDAYSRYTCIYGMRDKSTGTVIDTLTRYQADHGYTSQYGYMNIERIRADAGTQFTSTEFKQHCWVAGIQLILAAPKKQYQNHLAERTWQTISTMSRSLLVHARLPDTFMFNALVYTCHIFNILPVKGLLDESGNVSTPYTLFHGEKPRINHFRVFGCPVVARKWSTPHTTSSKQTERGIRGIFLGFDYNQKGYVFYSPGSRQIYISGDVLFDETFGTAIATTWRMHHDSLALRPLTSSIPTMETPIEETGAIDNFPIIAKEGNAAPPPAHATSNAIDDDDDVSDLLHPDDDSSVSYSEQDEEEEDIDDLDLPDDLDFHNTPIEEDISPQPLLDPSSQPRRSTRVRKPSSRYAYHTRRYDWMNTTTNEDIELCLACATEAILSLPIKGSNIHSWEPAPRTIRDILKMPDVPVKREWLKAVRKELKALVDSRTFIKDTLNPGETSTPVMEIFKVKIQSDGTLDKLKMRMVVRGDLQAKDISEDKWSPTASFRSLKMFLAHAARLKVRVRQLDFVGEFLQAKMRTRMFITISKIYGILFPEYAEYCGQPVKLQMSMYGTTLCGKYWYLDLLDFLKEIGFKEGDCIKCFFVKEFKDGSKIFLLNYVDDMLYYGTNTSHVEEFEKQLGDRFNLELLGQAHWYLGTRIKQLSNFDIELDQHRYCRSIVKKYLDSAGCPKNNRKHDTSLSLEFIPTSDDCSEDEAKAQALAMEYNIDFASCVGSLIYLGMTRTDISYAVNKLAKYTRKPGRNYFEALLHLLRYLRDNDNLGLRYYSNIQEAPLTKMLTSQNISDQHLFYGFSDSSWNDDQDSGRSTGCFIITYMGGVDHSSNLPDPVALSSAEAEYNEECIALMAASHYECYFVNLRGLRNLPCQLHPSTLTAKAP
jgi:transposase InsO family protein